MRQTICFSYYLLSLFWFSAATDLAAQDFSDKKIKANFSDTALDLALLDLKINYKLHFEYDEKEVHDIRITKAIPKLPLDDAMSLLLQGTGLSHELKPTGTVAIFKNKNPGKSAVSPSLFQPKQFNITVSGSIKDDQTGETLPFANLLVVGTTIGGNTNVDGYFTLFGVPNDTALIEISYIGYRTQFFRLKPGMDFQKISIRLSPEGGMLQEVVVTATQQEQLMQASTGISKLSISPVAIAALPSLGEKDIFRSLQLLPGVSASNEGSSGLYVRGGTPDQNLVLFDGFTVYHVDHLFGFFSAFNSNAIKDVQLYKGGFESKYGGRLSSVVDITGKDGNAEKFNTGAGLSLLSANAFAEMPFAKGKGTVLLAGRRSFQSGFYNDLLDFSGGDGKAGEAEETETEQPAFGRRAMAQVEPKSWFYDLNGKATFRTERDIFSLSLYNGKDDLDNSRYSDQNSFGRPGSQTQLNLNFTMDILDKSDWGNTGGSVKWSRRWNDKLYSNALFSRSNYFSHRDRGIRTVVERDTTTSELNAGTVEDNDLTDFSLKWDWEWQPKPMHKVAFGAFGTALDIKYDFVQNDTITVLARDDQGGLAGAYLQSQSTFGKLIVTPGLRATYFGETSQPYLEPRLQVQFLPTNSIKLKAATGRYYQFANRIIREDISQGSRDFWVLSDGGNVPVGRSDHFILGASYETPKYLFDVEGYLKNIDNLTEYSTRFVINGFGQNTSLDFEENFYQGTGIAKGIDFLIQKKTGKLTGWASYTLGQVRNEFEVYGDDPFPASHDVTHEGKLVGMYHIGKWSFGGTFIYATGKPYTAPLGAYTVELLDGATTDHFAVSGKNALRLPDYHRLDLSVTHDFDRFLGGKASAGLSLFNVYNRSNVWYKEYEVVDGVILETNVNMLGVTPSLFFNWSLK